MDDQEDSQDTNAAPGGFLAPPTIEVGIKTANPTPMEAPPTQTANTIKIAKPIIRQRSYTINAHHSTDHLDGPNNNEATSDITSTHGDVNLSIDANHHEENSCRSIAVISLTGLKSPSEIDIALLANSYMHNILWFILVSLS